MSVHPNLLEATSIPNCRIILKKTEVTDFLSVNGKKTIFFLKGYEFSQREKRRVEGEGFNKFIPTLHCSFHSIRVPSTTFTVTLHLEPFIHILYKFIPTLHGSFHPIRVPSTTFTAIPFYWMSNVDIWIQIVIVQLIVVIQRIVIMKICKLLKYIIIYIHIYAYQLT